MIELVVYYTISINININTYIFLIDILWENIYLYSRKEVIQPQVLLRLPCYDFTPVADSTVGGS